ncbi:amine oxidase [Pandoraea terrae]|uniref:Amine oxidase n=1 Tax=Pandoraea terrae TaxID=1537710 RepID=A0A5E4Y3G0_9BURK|nr:FAD-dependent oxidoreductase [Pandoraea terrae]VVE43150.1 amine oxidase [Pandoraea terrae]
MVTARIAIGGGGLSGLYAAFLLEQQGIKDYVLLEARHTIGGRIESMSVSGVSVSGVCDASDDPDRFDLGPTWFWPAFQPQLDRVIRNLGLERFEQCETGDMMIERSPHEQPSRMHGYTTSPRSMRLVGGMGALIDALRRELSPARLVSDRQVRHLRCADHHVELDAEDSCGQLTSYCVQYVLLAVPPRLVTATIGFTPALPDKLARKWRDTGTWMARHAKYVAVYETPFWRAQGLSGEGRSARGPLSEIHDASTAHGSAALFGFFSVPARVRSAIPDGVLRSHCRTQLTRLFGPQAATPKAEFIKDWASDPYTANATDLDAIAQHGTAPPTVAKEGVWQGRIAGIASEWSPQFPGYVAGAIEAASLGVRELLEVVTPQDRLLSGAIQ